MNKLYTKPTLVQRAKAFWSEYACVILGVACVLGVVIILVLTPKREYLKAPVQSCKSVYTGNQKTEQWISYQCAAYDRNMVCTVNMPVYNEHTYREVNNQCNWNEWR